MESPSLPPVAASGLVTARESNTVCAVPAVNPVVWKLTTLSLKVVN